MSAKAARATAQALVAITLLLAGCDRDGRSNVIATVGGTNTPLPFARYGVVVDYGNAEARATGQPPLYDLYLGYSTGPCDGEPNLGFIAARALGSQPVEALALRVASDGVHVVDGTLTLDELSVDHLPSASTAKGRSYPEVTGTAGGALALTIRDDHGAAIGRLDGSFTAIHCEALDLAVSE